MQTITAGEELTAAVLNDWTPQPQTSTATAATNFSVSNFTVYKVAGVTWFSVVLSYSGSTLTGGTGGALTNTACVTLPFAPQANMVVAYQAKTDTDGVIQIDTTGLCTILTLAAGGTILSGSLITFSGTILTG